MRALRQLVTGARNGISGAVVVRGDPGMGKTALLEHLIADLSGVTLVRSDGFEAERSLPYAGLQRVGMALLDHVAALPSRQQQALRVAWGSDEGPAPDRYLVGLAMLAVFAEAGGTRPVVCVLDDAHWLDSESRDVLAFAARRLQAESTVLLFSARDDQEADVQLAGIPSLRLAGLDTRSAVQLLSCSATTTLDPLAATQIAEATGGNPLALIDLGRDLGTGQVDQLSLSIDPLPLSRQLEARYLRQVGGLSADVQRWLLVAAAETSGHNRLIAAAAARLELSPDCAADAQRAGLVTVGDRVAFRHPLVRSAVYGAPPAGERRHVHAALGAAAQHLGLVELEAWHAAEATVGVDAAAAERLEAAAGRAARRGALVSQARLLARAAELSPVGANRTDFLLAAAEVAGEAGAAVLSRELLDRIDSDDLDPIQHGRRIMARTQAAIFVADPAGVRNAPADMLMAAQMFHGHDPERERRALLRAFEFALVTELLMEGTTLRELGHRMEEGAGVADGCDATVLRALASHILRPYSEAVPLMRRAIEMLAELDDGELPNFGFVGIALTTALFDEQAGAGYLSRLARIAREAGALRALDTALWVRSLFELGRGDPAAGGRYAEQVRELRRAIGYEAENVVNISYLAWTGVPRDQVEQIAHITHAMGFGGVSTSASAALGVRDIAEARYGDAYQRLRSMIDAPFLQVTYLQLADYVEAATRSGHRTDAIGTAKKVSMLASSSGTAWLSGLEYRCLALLANDSEAEGHFHTAIDYLSKAEVPAELGRAHLLYGEWLRRVRRRRDARAQLRTAADIFDRIGAPAFARRARTELAATGETMTNSEVVAGVDLSPRETTVARMAAGGNTNAEIGAALFISTNTVDYHLRKVFQKLGISSRRQLAERFDASG